MTSMTTTTESVPTPLRPTTRDGSRRRSPARTPQRTAWAFVLPIMIYLGLFYGYPLYRSLELSLRNYTVRSFVQGGAPFVGLGNYARVIADPTFAPAALHTLAFTLVSILCQFVLGMALAVFFFQHFRLSSVLRALFLVPWLLPLLVSASTWSWMLNSDSGVVNSFLEAVGVGQVNWLTSPDSSLAAVTVANIWIGIPFNLVILYSGLQTIPTQVYEASALDGAGAWRRFWAITFPLLRPVSAITLLLGFVYTLKVFDIIWIMTRGGPAEASTTLAVWSYQLGFGSTLPKISLGAAVGNLLILVALVFGLIYVRAQKRLEV